MAPDTAAQRKGGHESGDGPLPDAASLPTGPGPGSQRATTAAPGWRVGDTVLNPVSGYTFTAVRNHDSDGLVWLELAPAAAHAQNEPPAGAVLLVRWIDGRPLPVVSLADGELYAVRSMT